MTGLAPEPVDRAIARILAGGLPARVEIDLNVRLGPTRTFSGFRHCDRIPQVGEPVTVYESESGIEGPAVCTGIDETKQLVYLDVDWTALREVA
jgi:hypothetical protein